MKCLIDQIQLFSLLRFKILCGWHSIAGLCSLSCHGDTIRQWYRTDFSISLHNHASNCAALCRDRAAPTACAGVYTLVRVYLFIYFLLWRRAERGMRWKYGGWDCENGQKREARGWQGEEWMMRTMSGKRKQDCSTCASSAGEEGGRERGWRDAATVQPGLPSVWSLQFALRGLRTPWERIASPSAIMTIPESLSGSVLKSPWKCID